VFQVVLDGAGGPCRAVEGGGESGLVQGDQAAAFVLEALRCDAVGEGAAVVGVIRPGGVEEGFFQGGLLGVGEVVPKPQAAEEGAEGAGRFPLAAGVF
jgi:hypothetical protein